MANTIKNIENKLREAIAFYWLTREQQKSRQTLEGKSGQGARSAVTGGAQMSKIIGLLTELMLEAGAKSEEIFQNKALELPGFFRPTKEWDLLVIRDQQLIAAIEAKSQVGPSFGKA